MMQSVNANRLCFLLAWLLLASGEFLFTDALSCLQSNDLFKLSELNNVIAGKMAPKKCSTSTSTKTCSAAYSTTKTFAAIYFCGNCNSPVLKNWTIRHNKCKECTAQGTPGSESCIPDLQLPTLLSNLPQCPYYNENKTNVINALDDSMVVHCNERNRKCARLEFQSKSSAGQQRVWSNCEETCEFYRKQFLAKNYNKLSSCMIFEPILSGGSGSDSRNGSGSRSGSGIGGIDIGESLRKVRRLVSVNVTSSNSAIGLPQKQSWCQVAYSLAAVAGLLVADRI
ncbi:hypothetical protein BOX15_Mlig007153g1 [Macrostomum lignano]|uniref:Uncharacterized protein n=1 Tax=Macrostomum lignano TaxID=282301 RepID=A0A267H7F8_9PLAT|nr:hypothetical protein BOX15_Mlig007153g1 [Macrostomum lignano]